MALVHDNQGGKGKGGKGGKGASPEPVKASEESAGVLKIPAAVASEASAMKRGGEDLDATLLRLLKVGIGRETALAKEAAKGKADRDAAIAELRAKLAPGGQVKTRGPKGKVYTITSTVGIDEGYVFGKLPDGASTPLRVDTIALYVAPEAPAAV